MSDRVSLVSERALRAERPRWAFWVLAALVSVGGIVLLALDRRLDSQLAHALADERIHIEQLTAIRRLARTTYVGLLESWLSRPEVAPTVQRTVITAAQRIRVQADELNAVRAINDDEDRAIDAVRREVHLWSDRVQQVAEAREGPAVLGELRLLLDAIDRSSDRVLKIISQEGLSTDGQVVVLHRRQATIQLAFGFMALCALGLAASWWRAKVRADRRYHRSEKAREEQERTAQLRAQFFSNLSHELRTPLVAVLGYASLLEHPSNESSVREYGARIQGEGQQLLGLINNILDAAKLEAGHVSLLIEDIPVRPLLQKCFARCEVLLGTKPVALVIDVPDDLPMLRGDFVKLQQAVNNLLANAIKFTASGQITLRARARGTEILMEVEDTGVGIPEEALERIWTPFEQVDGSVSRAYGGTGLGLSIVRAIVEHLEGSVAVRSTPGVGTTFTLSLPCARVEGDRPAASPAL